MLPGRKYTPEDFLWIAWRRKWLILLPLIAVSAATFAVTRRLPDQFRSETTILVVRQRVPESYVRSTITDRIEDRLQSLQQQILSRSRLERIILDLNLYPGQRSAAEMEDHVTRIGAAVKVEKLRGDAFTVSYVSRDPQIAQIVTERLASLFIEENVRDREVLADGTSEFLRVQLDDARKRLIEQEKKLEGYRLRHAGELPSQAASNLQGVQTGRLQMQALADSINRDRDRQLLLERQLADLLGPEASGNPGTPSPAGEVAPPPGGAATSGLMPDLELREAREQLQLLAGRLTDAHPEIVRLRRRVHKLEQLTASSAAAPSAAAPVTARTAADLQRERRIRDIRAEVDAVSRRIAAQQQEQQRVQAETALFQARLEAAPIRESEQTELMRDYETLQQIYRNLLAKREDSKIAANLERRQVGEQFRVLDPARVPERPFSPDRLRLNLIGAFVGLLIGVAFTAGLEYMDTTLKTEEDIRMVLGLPVVATIPILASPLATIPLRARLRWVFTGAAAVAAVVGMIAWTLRG